MGHYTRFNCNITLKKDTPELIIDFFKRVLIDRDLGHNKVMFSSEDVFKPEFEHEFFKCDRWYMMLLSNNWDNTIRGSKIYFKNNYWHIGIDSEFKNYDNEIDKFIDWITPYIVGRKKKQYLGYYKPESIREQINIYINR